MNHSNRFVLRGLSVLLILVAVYAFLNYQPEQEEMQPAINTGAPRPLYWAVGLTSYRPFTYRNEQGQLQGLDVDLLQAAAHEVGIEITIRPHDMENLLRTLDDGSADIVMGGIQITPARQQKYLFTRPYFEGRWGILAPINAPTQWSLWQNQPLAVLSGTVAQERADALTTNKHAVQTIFMGIGKIKQQQAAGILDLDIVLRSHQPSDWRVVPDSRNERVSIAFVVNKNNPLLKRKLDEGLAAIRNNGQYKAILEKYGL